jgi:uncharacterized Fe-S cluster-containing radical SAM superfamily enzyme
LRIKIWGFATDAGHGAKVPAFFIFQEFLKHSFGRSAVLLNNAFVVRSLKTANHIKNLSDFNSNEGDKTETDWHW